MNHLNTSIVSLTLTVVLFAALRLVQTQLSAETSKLPPFLGGFLGSNIFIFLLTAVSNLEMEIFDDAYQARFFPEVACCLFLGALAASTVHRISVTLCVFFSAVLLYYANKISVKKYQRPTGRTPLSSGGKKWKAS